MLDREGRPIIINWFTALFVTAAVVLIYALVVPFTFSFRVNGEVVYTQKDVRVFTDFEKNASETEEGDVVYADGAVTFSYLSGEKKEKFEKPYDDIRMDMLLKAITNFITLKWDRTDFVIEMDA